MRTFLIIISRLKIIIEDKITNIPPINDFKDGTSPHIKCPKKIANINPKYFNGVTKDTSENL